MVQIGKPYDPGQHKPIEPRDPLSAGWYAMQIIKSEVRKTSGGDGQFLELTLEIMEAVHPELKGRRVWDRLNLWNPSSKAVDFANAKLSSICKAVGQLQAWDDTSVLHGRPLAIKVKVRQAEGKYDAQNEVSDYDSVASRFQTGAPVPTATMTVPPSAAAVAPPTAAPPPQGQPGPGQAGGPPWGGKS